MSYKNILMAVEPHFNITHVGVLRVIRYHFKDLVARGHSVTLATFRNGKWISCSMLDATRAILGDTRRADLQKPYWQSGTSMRTGSFDVLPHETHWPIRWDGKEVNPEDFDESILTNPWLCSQFGESIADSRFSVGIAYDMVPNLIALGILRMPQFLDIYQFANEHHIGYDYFLRNVDTISCISESTRQDFLRLYCAKSGAESYPRVEVCIPFADFGNGLTQDESIAQDVLMINVLDHRKNFLTVAKALEKASASVELHAVIVGRERLPNEEVTKFLNDLSQICASVRWYRSPSDAQVQELMSKAKVVFFPSFYEGLGLPILEAQARGVPVISSNNSSCGEINLNSLLTADPYDYHAFAEKLVSLLSGDAPIIKNVELRNAQNTFLSKRNQLFTSAFSDGHDQRGICLKSGR
jgi:glycosyltransferase involved in cell wall biosynthesis